MSTTNDIPGIDWSGDRVLPAFQRPEHLAVYDIRSAPRDVQLSVATLVGLINRPQPRVYLLCNSYDAFWLEHVLTPVPHTLSPLAGSAILAELLTTYRALVNGYIVYDPAVPDSINIATMMAGQQNGVIISPDQGKILLDSPQKMPILNDLRKLASQWPSRLHVYCWAQEHLLAGASTHMIAGLEPTKTISIRSYLVANRAFIYWLDARAVLPDVRLRLLSEHMLMRQLFNALAPGAVHMGWFLNEGTGVMMTSRAAKLVFASDFSNNLEVWSSIEGPGGQPQESTVGEREPLPEVDARKVYVSFTLSEGDNLQYIQGHMLDLWRDPARGSVPIGWTISPALMQAAPAIAAYYASTATPSDAFIGGPSGAGYMYPSFWPVEQYPAYMNLTGKFMQQMNLTLLEILDSNVFQSIPLTLRALLTGAGMALIDKDRQRRFVEGLAPFGVRGLLSGGGQSTARWNRVSNVPIFQNVGIAGSVNQAVEMIQQAATGQQRPFFVNLYALAWQMTPTKFAQVREELGSEYEVVTPHTLLELLR